MKGDRLESGAGVALNVVELATGRRLAGRLELGQEDFQLRVFCFGEGPEFQEADTIDVLGADHRHYTLFDCHVVDPPRLPRNGEEYREIMVLPAYVVAGPKRWSKGDRYLRLQFSIPDANHSLTNHDREKEFAKSVLDSRYQFRLQNLAEIAVNGGRLYLKEQYLYTRPIGFDAGHQFEFEYDLPRTVEHIREAVDAVRSFMSFSCAKNEEGGDLRLGPIHLCVHSGEEEIKMLEGRVHAPAFEYFTPGYLAMRADYTARWLGHFRCVSNSSISRFCDALHWWLSPPDGDIRKGADGRNPMVRMLMCRALRSAREVSPARLISACSWLDLVGPEQEVREFDDRQIDGVNAILFEGTPSTRDRVRGALHKLVLEDASSRWSRLTGMLPRERLKETFRHDDQAIVRRLRDARKFRGAAAHGVVTPRDDDAMERFFHATTAVEMMAFYLTVREMPHIFDEEVYIFDNSFLREYFR